LILTPLLYSLDYGFRRIIDTYFLRVVNQIRTAGMLTEALELKRAFGMSPV